MSLILASVIISIVIWLIFKLILTEIPSLRAIIAISKLHGPGGYPFFLGITKDFLTMKPKDIIGYLQNITDEYPRLAAFYIAGTPCIMVQNPEDIKHILGHNRNIKKGFEYKPMFPWLNEGLLTSYGSKWHTRRKLLTPTFHFKILDNAIPSMVYHIDILTKKLSESNGNTVIVDDYITPCTIDVMGETSMGVHLNAQSSTSSSYIKSVQRATEIIIERILSVYLMKDFIFNFSSMGKEFSRCLSSLHAFTGKVIADRKKTTNDNENSTHEDSFGRKEKKAFLDSLLSMQKSDPESFSDRDIREEVDTFMFEGHDTTSSALCFCLWLLGSHPAVQEKLYTEIMEKVGDNEFTMANINGMIYLEKVIKESLRLYPSVPYISRKITEDIILDDGTVIPEGINTIIMPYLVHRHKDHYPDPEIFDPERFTEASSKGRHPYAYIPFSAGPRNCIGQKFAMIETKITVASIVRKLKIRSLTDVNEFKIVPNLIMKPTVPLECQFSKRKS